MQHLPLSLFSHCFFALSLSPFPLFPTSCSSLSPLLFFLAVCCHSQPRPLSIIPFLSPFLHLLVTLLLPHH
ncbi:MAG: hypothetical protein J3R72DRAFT_453085, partial [Linnemannia gamsii]